MVSFLEDIIEAFPGFLTDEDVNGGDLVEFVGDMVTRYEDGRPRPVLTGMTELGDRNYTLIASGCKAHGTYDPDVILYVFEEELYTHEADEIVAFLRWVHAESITFGHGNYEQVFSQFKGQPLTDGPVTGTVYDDRGDNEQFPRSDWQYEVANGDTGLGYSEWLEGRIEMEADENCDTCGAAPGEVHPPACADAIVTESGFDIAERMLAEKWFCAGEHCPGLSYKASQHPHPSTCVSLKSIGEDRPEHEASDICVVGRAILVKDGAPFNPPRTENDDVNVMVIVTAKAMLPQEHLHELDQHGIVGVHPFRVPAWPNAVEAALDAFHSTVPIKVLDDFEITSEVQV